MDGKEYGRHLLFFFMRLLDLKFCLMKHELTFILVASRNKSALRWYHDELCFLYSKVIKWACRATKVRSWHESVLLPRLHSDMALDPISFTFVSTLPIFAVNVKDAPDRRNFSFLKSYRNKPLQFDFFVPQRKNEEKSTRESLPFLWKTCSHSTLIESRSIGSFHLSWIRHAKTDWGQESIALLVIVLAAQC